MRAMEIRTLIRAAAQSGVRLWVEGGQLRYRATSEGLSGTLRTALQSRRDDLVGALSTPVFSKRGYTPDLVEYPPFWQDFWQETQTNLSLCNAIHLAMRFVGNVSLERIEAALERVTARHDLLRSTIELRDGIPCLRFERQRRVLLDIVDLAASPAPERPGLVKTLAEQAIYAPLEDGLLYRARIIRSSDNDHVFAFVMHHFVADPISSAIVAGELIASLRARHDSHLLTGERPLQYSDYLLAMLEWLPGEGVKYRLAYWRAKMRGAPPVHFPPQHDPPPTPETGVRTVNIDVSETSRASLARAAAAFETPLGLILLTATFAALARTLRSTDLVAIVIHNSRDDPALHDMLGFTLNCFPVRVSVPPGMSYAELLASVADNYALARDYQVPWSLLTRTLGEIDVSCVAPIFNYLPLPRAAPGIRSSAPQIPLQIEHLPVAGPPESVSVDWKSHELHIFDNDKDLRVTLKYTPSTCSSAAVERFSDSFRLGLDRLIRDPTGPVDP